MSNAFNIRYILRFLPVVCILYVYILAHGFFSIDRHSYLTEDDLTRKLPDGAEKIPHIVHRLAETSIPSIESCRNRLPDYDFILWTDVSSRSFIAKEYPWFLETYDSYPLPFQRLDAFSYFVLHHYGGIYISPKVNCESNYPFDTFLTYPVVLQSANRSTISNKVIFAAPNHPFLEQVIHGLKTSNALWPFRLFNRAMTTGNMFLSIHYAMWKSSHRRDTGIRILPRNSLKLFKTVRPLRRSWFAGLLWFLMAGVILICLKLIWWRSESKAEKDHENIYLDSF